MNRLLTLSRRHIDLLKRFTMALTTEHRERIPNIVELNASLIAAGRVSGDTGIEAFIDPEASGWDALDVDGLSFFQATGQA
jgi:methylglyoxal synthase